MAKITLFLIMLGALPGCTTMMSASSYCRIASVTWLETSDKFSAKTGRKIAADNDKYIAVCGDKDG